MRNSSIILIWSLVALMSCTKSREVHPELGDGNEEFLTVGATTAHVEYTRADMAELRKVEFHYGLSGAQQFAAAEMAKKEGFFDLTLNDLASDTLYQYYYELFPSNGEALITEQKTFHTLAVDSPVPPTPPVVELPTVVTIEVSGITANSAVCGGEVTNDGGATVTERGICWSTNANPTLNDNNISSGTGMGAFTAMMENLEANTTYHVRAYATNEAGTAYGLDNTFTTLSGGGSGDAPIGAINGLFTINADGDQVYFSQGNLQYQASTNTWRFAEKQWDYVGEANANISQTYSGWIDLFGWGTSGWNNGNLYYQPYDCDFLNVWNAGDYGYGYGPTDGTNYHYDLTGQYANADWGVYNAISNGGNLPNQWRTLTYDEWECIINDRITLSGSRYVKAIVNSLNGIVLLPDNFDSSIYQLNYPNRPDAPFSTNVIDFEEWNVLEVNGCVFLPAAGGRYGNSYSELNIVGYYRSSSSALNVGLSSYGLRFRNNEFINLENSNRESGLSVRLVQDANP